MAAGIDPIFIEALATAYGRVAAANTNKDGTGTLVTLLTGGTDGSAIYSLFAKAEVTTTAGVLKFFIDNGAGNPKFWRELLISAVTSSGSALTWQEYIRSPDGMPLLVLKNGEILKCCMQNNEAIIVGVDYGGDF